jgi:hypothetical protein
MGIFIPMTKTSSWVYFNRVLISFQLFSFKRKGVKRFVQSIWFKTFLLLFLFQAWEQECSNSQVLKDKKLILYLK